MTPETRPTGNEQTTTAEPTPALGPHTDPSSLSLVRVDEPQRGCCRSR
ncbi:hypothetical protein ACLMAL_05665 [Nocardia sp. CWNU-33]